MPSLPRKARNGDDFKSYTTSAINKLIDYLHSMRPKDSPDIKVKESASGVMFELANRPKMTPQVASTGGGGTTYGIEATIDGSTASVALVEGGTASSVSIVPTAPITLSIGVGGELIIGSTASGGGFGPPDFSATPIEIQGNTPVVTTSHCWLWGDVSLGGSNILSGSVTLIINVTGSSVTKELIQDTGRYALSNHNNYFTVGVCEAIPSGATVTVIEHSPGQINTLRLYPSL